MIVCPACHAENPDGTKICVKCGTELPKAPAGAAKAKGPVESGDKKYQVRDMARDLVEFLWLLLIIILVCGGFWGELTHWTFKANEQEEVKLVPAPTQMAKAKRSSSHHGASRAKKAGPVTSENPPVELGSPETFYKKGKDQYDSHHYQQSFTYLKRALEIDPTYAKAYFALGYLYSRFDMDDAAVRMYKMSLRFDPNDAQVMNNLGVRLKKEGNYDEAIPLFQKAVEADAQNADYRFYLGDAYLDQNQTNEALQELQKAAELRPNDPDIYYELAISYEKMGKKAEAIETWQRVIQNSKDADMTQNAQTHVAALQTAS